MNSRQIIVRGLLVNYYYDESAPPASQAVVFLHGWRSNAMIWRPILESFHSTYRLYAIDFPGFGNSELPRAGLHLKDYSDIVAGFVEKLDLKRVCVVGHSFGGRVAIKLAVNHPALIERMVLVDSGGIRSSETRRRIITTFAKILHPVFALPLLRTLRPRIYNMLGAADYLATPELRQTFLNIIEEEPTPYLNQVRCSTLIVWGEKDQEAPLSAGQTKAKLIPRARLVVFPMSGHFSFLDRPEEFNQALTGFLNEPR